MVCTAVAKWIATLITEQSVFSVWMGMAGFSYRDVFKLLTVNYNIMVHGI
jgi:hypothetical protein